MQLLVVRHAIAENRETFARTGQDDSERPLTAEGRRKFTRGARGLRGVVPAIDLLATSALQRAVETTRILQKEYGIDTVETLAELLPEADPAQLVDWLARQRRRALVAVVGHEPHLSHLVGYLLAQSRRGFVDIKKGGACLIEVGERSGPGQGTLCWLLTAWQLRRLGKAS